MQEARTRSIQTLNLIPKLKKIIKQIKPQLLNATQHIRYPRNDLRVNDLNWTEIDEIQTNSLLSLCSVLTEIAGCLKSCQVSVIHIDLRFKLTCNITRLYLMLHSYPNIWVCYMNIVMTDVFCPERRTKWDLYESKDPRRTRAQKKQRWILWILEIRSTISRIQCGLKHEREIITVIITKLTIITHWCLIRISCVSTLIRWVQSNDVIHC